MQVVNMSASIQSQSSTRSAQSSSRDGTGGINQPSDVCDTKYAPDSFQINLVWIFLVGEVHRLVNDSSNWQEQKLCGNRS